MSSTQRRGASLDSLASLFVQVSPEDPSSVEELVREIRSLLAEDVLESAQRTPIEKALDALEQLLAGREADFAGVSRLIEEALAAAGDESAPAGGGAAGASAQDMQGTPGERAGETDGVPDDAAEDADGAGRGRADAVPAEVLADDADAELLEAYVTEGVEILDGAEAALLDLERDPENGEAVNTVFRAFHTIKGTSAFIGLQKVSEFAHRAENLLSRVRDGSLRYSGVCADLALRSVDLLRACIERVSGAEAGASVVLPAEMERLSAELDAALADGGPGASRGAKQPAKKAKKAGAKKRSAGRKRKGGVKKKPAAGQAQPPAEEPVASHAQRAAATGGEQPSAAARAADRAGGSGGGQPAGAAPGLSSAARPAGEGGTSGATKQKAPRAGGERAQPHKESSVRVRTDRLDRLIDLVGELVIAHSMVAQDETALLGGHQELSRKISHAGKIVRELQDLSMSLRMVPLRSTFQKASRVARDAARRTGKEVDFVSEGDDTEIDRNMVDYVGDPLVHMVRNSVDHGIEPPDERERAGKPRRGTVTLSAYHSGGHVVIELADDGRGISKEKILAKAREKGIADASRNLTDQEIFQLLFAPGFSTAEKVSELSGRGVGLDVVRRNIENLDGRIEVSSELGRGTTFRLLLPLTLAITNGMLVRIGRQRFLIPTVAILTSFRPRPENVVQLEGRGEMLRLREEVIPLFRMAELVGCPADSRNPEDGLVIVLEIADRKDAYLVDEILGQHNVVAKSIGRLCRVPGVSGGAILGDGTVGLILDPQGLADLGRRRARRRELAPVGAGGK